jgi:hypothetical protein
VLGVHPIEFRLTQSKKQVVGRLVVGVEHVPRSWSKEVHGLDIDHKALIGIRFMHGLHIMHPSNPRDERRHYPIILHGLKHIGVMETLENVVDEDGGDEEHP